MTPLMFWLYTTLIGSVFAYALLWAISEWLKADEEIKEVKKPADVIKEMSEARKT